jgi:hypothetical protein
VKPHQKDWVDHLNDALWGYRTAYKIRLGMSPFRMVFGKACHLPVKLEHKVEWAIRTLNLNPLEVEKHRKLQL